MILTLITDAIQSLSNWQQVKSERYYYSSNKLFEQSLDIYRPPPSAVVARNNASKHNDESSSSSSPTPVVALVVGSAWLGHRSWVYSGTSWWNSSGPKSIANLGYICVCIRHRGSFMKTFSILTLIFIAIMVAMISAILNAIVDEKDAWNSLEDIFGTSILVMKDHPYSGGILLTLLATTGIILMEIGNIGAATHEMMQHDVMDALEYLHTNEGRLGLKRATTTAVSAREGQQKDNAKPSSRRLFIFGGYSSGGHVAATVSQQPHLWKDRNLPPPHVHCDSILYISPVLSTKSYNDVLMRKNLSPSSTTSLPSLVRSELSTSSDQLSRQSSMVSEAATEVATTSLSLPSSKSPPTWLTDQVVKTVFGSDQAPKIPSPVHTYDKSPTIPHIFLGCRHEMFGLTWLDTFFCSPSYSDLLNGMGIESRYTAVESDHWNILNSTTLRDALKKELQWIEQLECRK